MPQNNDTNARIDIEKLFTIVADLKEEDRDQKEQLKELDQKFHALVVEQSRFQARIESRLDYLEEQLNNFKRERDKQFQKNTTMALVWAGIVGAAVQVIALLIEHFSR